MSKEDFSSLVNRLEQQAERNPSGYRRQVLGLAVLGYGYIYVWLVLLIGVVVGLAALFFTGNSSAALFKLLLFFGAMCVVLIRSLWVRLTPPEGLELRRDDAPELFQTIDELTMAMKTPRVHTVLLTDDFNAAMAQNPRLGVFGWQKNYLILGLPLMQALSPDQFRFVIAHELGHLGGQHSRFSAWIYRIEKTWSQVLTEFEKKEQKGAFLFKWFFKWFVPYFRAYSFVLRRNNEYEADHVAAQAVGAEHAAAALINLGLKHNQLSENFWPQLYKQAESTMDVPAVYTQMNTALKEPVEASKGQFWLERALRAETGIADTHPALSDRLRSLQQSAFVPQAAAGSAAEAFFGGSLGRFTDLLNREWQQNIRGAWQERFEQRQEQAARLAELDAQAQQEALSEEEAYEQARLTHLFRGSEASLPLVKALAEQHPEDPTYSYAYGYDLLELGEEAGVAQMERTMELDPSMTYTCCEQIYGYLMRQGREEEAKPYADRAIAWHYKVEAAHAERAGLAKEDNVLPHTLNEEGTAFFRQAFANQSHIQEAYVVRKDVEHFPGDTYHVVGLVISPTLLGRLSAEEWRKDFVKEVVEYWGLPNDFLVISLSGKNKALLKKMRAVQGSRLK